MSIQKHAVVIAVALTLVAMACGAGLGMLLSGCAGEAEERTTDQVMSYSFAPRQSSAYTCGEVPAFSGPATAVCERAVRNQTDTEVLCDDLAAGVFIRDMYIDPKPAADGSHRGLYQVTSDACEGVYDVTAR